jgi:3-oxoacyl-[acyl-carrier-protein] synthase III
MAPTDIDLIVLATTTPIRCSQHGRLLREQGIQVPALMCRRITGCYALGIADNSCARAARCALVVSAECFLSSTDRPQHLCCLLTVHTVMWRGERRECLDPSHADGRYKDLLVSCVAWAS